MRRNSFSKGFTLLELSIVLIIISLLVGGVMLTKSLVRQAKMQGMISEYDKYARSIYEFRDKYHALPGDMKNATDLWGAAVACPNIDSTTSPQVATCNGDGNGRIGTSDGDGNLSTNAEWWQAWQHLSNAKLIDGMFNGAYGSGGADDAVLDTNVPSSVLKPGGWTLLYYLFTNAVTTDTWADKYGHILAFGDASAASSYTKGAAIISSEAMAIDQKIDDGKPGMGTVRAWKTGACISGDVQKTAAYTIDATSTAALTCSLYFILGF